MKPKFYLSIIFFLMYVSVHAQTPVVSLLKKYFSSEEAQQAKISNDASFMTVDEQHFVFYMNLCRLYPKQFAEFYVAYLKEYDEYGYQKLKKKDKYYYSLLKDLKAQESLPRLNASKEMFELAKCWAIESGKKGVTGHDRKKCEKGYRAECCSYSSSPDLMNFLFNLLVDEGVSSLGHRKAIFNQYRKVGVSIQKHKTYGHCIVIDFSY